MESTGNIHLLMETMHLISFVILNITSLTCLIHVKTVYSQDSLVTFGDSVYSFVSTSPLDWKSARDACEKTGGLLVIIDTKEEREFVISKLNGTQSGWWLAGQDMTTAFKFRWLNSTLIPKEIFDWYPGVWDASLFDFRYKQPSDPFESQDQDCLEYRQWNIDGQNKMLARPYWNDAPCANKNSYICEAPKQRNCGFEDSPQSMCSAAFRTRSGLCRTAGKLSNNLVTTRTSRSLLQCALECFQHIQPLCLSANFKQSKSLCELSKASKSESPSDYVNDPMYSYIAGDAC